MKNIQILSPLLANQIAAGEVIERPASVIKELLENSFDAGATEILIEVEQGGQQLIRVRDNGLGIRKEELALALSRHATSKISVVNDLDQIHSLGFRGEALASISAVSRIELTSRFHEAELAFIVRAQDGEIDEPKPAAHPSGTTIAVNDLFYNTPARRKFLRSPATEIQQIEKSVLRLALSHFSAAIKLKHNNRDIFALTAATTRTQQEQRISKLLGTEFLQQAFFIEFEAAGMKLSGWLAEPKFNRSQTDMQYFYINNRFVRDKVLTHALRDAYHDVMFHGRHAAFILYLTIDPKLVDVNVHPTKHEVRFRDSHSVHELVRRGVKEALAQIRPGEIHIPQPQAGMPHFTAPAPRNYPQYQAQETVELAVHEPQAHYQKSNYQIEVANLPKLGMAIAQLKQTFILAQSEAGLVIVDMHAAHERVLYEKLKAQEKQQKITVQQLLVPLTLSLSLEEMQIWQERLNELKQAGINTEQVGPCEIIVREIPSLFAKANIKQLICDSLADWLKTENSDRTQHQHNHILATIACHAAVRAPHELSITEMNALLRDMEQTPHGGLCNHGRPTWKLFNYSEMDAWFLRGR